MRNLVVPFSKEWKETSKEIYENSIYLQDRYKKNFLESIQSYKFGGRDERYEQGKSKIVGEIKDTYHDMAWYVMLGVRWGDYGAIIFGGMPVYKIYKQQAEAKGLRGQAAIDYAINKFDIQTKKTQQSGDLQDRDYYQTGDPWQRGLNLFQTAQKQYLRKTSQAVRNLYRVYAKKGEGAKGTALENWRIILTYHVLLPTIFQLTTTGFAGLFRERGDEEEVRKDYLRHLIIGNLNALFIIGPMIDVIANLATDKPWASKIRNIPLFDVVSGLAEDVMKIKTMKTETPKQIAARDEEFVDLLMKMMQLVGVPAPHQKRS